MFARFWLAGRVGSESSSREKPDGDSPPPVVKAKSCASSGTASLVTVNVARLVFTHVQVTTSPADTSMLDTGLPSLQVAEVWSQPPGTLSASEYPPPGITLLKLWVLESAGSESSSSANDVGDSPPAAVNEKSCGSLGTASLTAIIWPRLRFENVQVTVSLALTLMFVIGLPSSQVADVWSQPEGTVSDSE